MRRGLVALACMSGVAYGYPENQRYGYNSCAACHVNPVGGGVLTNYGRGFGEELSTVHDENAGGLVYGLVVPPDWLLVGGDTRYLDLRTATEHQTFLMQDDVEVAVKPGKELTAVASYGHYYGGRGPESRRHYVEWSPNDNFAVVVGHFFAPYGIFLPDHTAATRTPLGYGEGAESYNAVATYRSKDAEIFLTATAGNGTIFKAEPGQGSVALQGNSYTARSSWFAAPGYTLGASYKFQYDSQHIFEQTMGPYVMMGLSPHAYLLSEADRRLANGNHFDVSYTEAGYEVYRGIHFQATHEYEHGNVFGLGLQLFPIAHFEVIAKAKYEASSGDVISELLLHMNW